MNLTAPPRASARSPVRSPLTEGGGGPSLDLNFMLGLMPAGLTFTRASSATYFDSNGVLQTAGTNTPRLDYNPATLALRGLLLEEQRTNSIRNNTMAGAVTGSPGTYPTNWFTGGNLLSAGIVQTIVGTGTEDGITYIDLRYAGTTTGAGAFLNLFVESQTLNAAASGQSWTSSMFLRLTAGSVSNVAVSVITFGRSNVGGNVESGSTSPVPTSAALRTQRYSTPYTMANAATAFATTSISFTVPASGAVVDFTLRVGLPQLELGSFATSVIQTTGATTTRAADICSMSAIASRLGNNLGTMAADFMVYQNDSTTFHDLIGVHSGTAADLILMRLSTGTTISGGNAWVGNVSKGGVSAANTVSVNTPAKCAVMYTSTAMRTCLNGGTVAGGVLTGIPSPTTLTIGNIRSGYTDGWIRRARLWKRALSDAELKAITT